MIDTAGQEAGKDRERIVNFSDGVFAIAITILILDINVPEGLSPKEVSERAFSLWPEYLGYVISFLVLAVYWQAHHRASGR